MRVERVEEALGGSKGRKGGCIFLWWEK